MNEILLADLVEEMKQLNKKLSNFNKEVFNSEEAAEYLRVGYSTFLREVRIGRIDHVKNGSSYIFKKEYLDKWLDKNKVRCM